MALQLVAPPAVVVRKEEGVLGQLADQLQAAGLQARAALVGNAPAVHGLLPREGWAPGLEQAEGSLPQGLHMYKVMVIVC